MLGSDIQNRLDAVPCASLQSLYSKQCVGVQGWEFRSHSHWQDWQNSVQRSAELVQHKLPENYVPLFRPPYGQRRADAAGFFNAQGLQVALWDIDAQDGPGKLKAKRVAQRVLTLMLLWRHGVIDLTPTRTRSRRLCPGC